MTDFVPSGQATAGLDPLKRVNYQLGLVLGEDEFRTDQFHLRERDHLATRALHGYGTVSGLEVVADGSQIRVKPGLAVDPAGRLICVPTEYCADINAWLTTNLTAAPDEISAVSPPESMPLYVVLCYTECETDDVPIPSESCLSAEDSRAASRIKESFELKIVTAQPPLVGEIAPGSFGGLEALVAELRGFMDVSGGSIPDFTSIDALIRMWAVERRPEVAAFEACLPAPTGEGALCVELARVDIDIDETASGFVAVDPVVDDADRPILVSTRFLQEALLSAAPADHVHAIDELTDVDAATPGDGDVLRFIGGDWQPQDPVHVHDLADLGDVAPGGANNGDALVFDGANWVPGVAGGGGVAAHADLTGLAGDDHAQYLLADGTRPLGGDLSAAGNRIRSLPISASGGDPLVRDEPAGGDLTGLYPDPTVAALQGTPVDAGAPRPGDALVFDGAGWITARPRLLPFATIEGLGDRAYGVWFNIDATANSVEVVDPTEAIAVQAERETGATFLRSVAVVDVVQIRRNVFKVALRENAPQLRFNFLLERIELAPGGETAEDWAARTGTWFEGQSGQVGERLAVTKFVVNVAGLV